MPVLDDIQVYMPFLVSDDVQQRREAQTALTNLGDAVLLYLVAELSVGRPTRSDAVIDSIFQTLHAIGTERIKEMVGFMAHAEQARVLWPPNIRTRAQTVAQALGSASSKPDSAMPDVAIRYLLFLLGSDNADERAVAHRILVTMGDSLNLVYFKQALENSALYQAFQAKVNTDQRLHQDEHPRPQAIFDVLRVLDPEGDMLHKMTSFVPDYYAPNYLTPDMRKLALEAAQVFGIDTSEWELLDAPQPPRDSSKIEYRACFVCNKRVASNEWIESDRAVFCSTECYKKAQSDHTYWM